MVCSPLACGILSGKYDDGLPGGSRATLRGFEWMARALLLESDVHSCPVAATAAASVSPDRSLRAAGASSAAAQSGGGASGAASSSSTAGASHCTAAPAEHVEQTDKEQEVEQDAEKAHASVSCLHAKLRLLAAIAERLSCSLAQLAIGTVPHPTVLYCTE